MPQDNPVPLADYCPCDIPDDCLCFGLDHVPEEHDGVAFLGVGGGAGGGGTSKSGRGRSTGGRATTAGRGAGGGKLNVVKVCAIAARDCPPLFRWVELSDGTAFENPYVVAVMHQKHALPVEWINVPDEGSKEEGASPGSKKLTFTTVDPVCDGTVVLSDGSCFKNPRVDASLSAASAVKFEREMLLNDEAHSRFENPGKTKALPKALR
jgi:hypothetical protein